MALYKYWYRRCRPTPYPHLPHVHDIGWMDRDACRSDTCFLLLYWNGRVHRGGKGKNTPVDQDPKTQDDNPVTFAEKRDQLVDF